VRYEINFTPSLVNLSLKSVELYLVVPVVCVRGDGGMEEIA